MPLQHGAARRGRRHPLYVRWVNIKQRCHNPNHPRFPDYGGRGILLHPAWHDFTQFWLDLGHPPGENWAEYSIDRIDVNRGYEPGNVRWATRAEQEANKRPNADLRRYQYRQPWPFGVLTLEKSFGWGGINDYLEQMLDDIAAGAYVPTEDEEEWLDQHEPSWRADAETAG